MVSSNFYGNYTLHDEQDVSWTFDAHITATTINII
jgi:hypothetical protein